MKSRRQLLVGLGAALLLPRSAFAQKPGRVWRVGVMVTTRRPETQVWERGYGQFPIRLKELGYVEGSNLVIEWRFADGDYTRLPELAAGLASLPVDVLVTDGTPGIRAAQGASKTIPIVFKGGADLVASGFVKSLAHPGGNTTGVSLLLSDSIGKQLELLAAIVPKLTRLAVLTNPSNPAHASLLKTFRETAAASRMQVIHVEARTPKEIGEALSRATLGGAEALIWTVDSFFIQQQAQIADLATKHRLPSMCGVQRYPEVGGLMAFGPDQVALNRRVADYVDKILKGANPGDLPVEQPKKLDLVINRTTAKALGLEIPADLLVQADKVIE